MTTKLTALALITVTALSLTPKPAAANDKGLAIVGGFIGGLIVGSAINDNPRYDSYPGRSTTIIVNGRDDRYGDGYWKAVTVKVWVPGCWIVERSHHGRSHRSYVGGHYEYRTDRIWVAYDRHDRHDRRVGYGYGYRR